MAKEDLIVPRDEVKYPLYISIEKFQYNKLIDQSKKIDDIIKTLKLIKDRLEIR